MAIDDRPQRKSSTINSPAYWEPIQFKVSMRTAENGDFFQMGWSHPIPVPIKEVPLKFIYSEKATKFCEIFPLVLTAVHAVKSKGKISQNLVAFSEYMNFTFIKFMYA